MTSRWFISFRYHKPSLFGLDGSAAADEGFGNVVTDVSPARWTLYSRIKHSRDHYVLYAEELSPALAVEMIHGGANVDTEFFKKGEVDEEDLDF